MMCEKCQQSIEALAKGQAIIIKQEILIKTQQKLISILEERIKIFEAKNE